MRLGEEEKGEERREKEEEGGSRSYSPPFTSVVHLIKAFVKFVVLGYVCSFAWSLINGDGDGRKDEL